MKKLLFLALAAASFTLASCEGNGTGSERGAGDQTTTMATSSPSEQTEAANATDSSAAPMSSDTTATTTP
ncbi:hypothetical protein FY528_00180 [Hymenobacter lutimineralis]|uniref:Entericidin n=1 Tax=Hymenobacter lutimineralis TaxID=2606448 RepID=A0A5D6VHK1_9BACT|nr:hypothetical protein [Hymenobacter lutimineralis]TYZ14188.1 hypothetical protein FY528_00180 [Hymenobacter lutimineralis]